MITFNYNKDFREKKFIRQINLLNYARHSKSGSFTYPTLEEDPEKWASSFLEVFHFQKDALEYCNRSSKLLEVMTGRKASESLCSNFILDFRNSFGSKHYGVFEKKKRLHLKVKELINWMYETIKKRNPEFYNNFDKFWLKNN